MGTPTILQVTAIPLTAAHFLLPLALGLRECGYETEFACGSGPERTQLEAAGFHVHTLPLQRTITTLRNGQVLLALTALMRRRQIQVLHAHTPVAGLLARLAARLAGVQTVFYTLHGSLWDQTVTCNPSLRTRLFTMAEWLGSRCTDHIFVLNDQDQAELVRRRFYRPTQITNLRVGGGGIDLQRFAPHAVAPAVRCQLRQTLQIPQETPVIGYVGRLVREKGILDLIAAYRLVHQQIPEAHLVLVGGTVAGEWDALSETTIREAVGDQPALQQQLHMTGFRKDIPELLSMMDLVVLPSWREGFGMVLAEAGAMMLPVVATRTSGSEQAVVDGETGLLTPKRCPSALAAAITRVLGNPKLAYMMGAAGRQRALQHFDQAQVVARQLDLYQLYRTAAAAHS